MQDIKGIMVVSVYCIFFYFFSFLNNHTLYIPASVNMAMRELRTYCVRLFPVLFLAGVFMGELEVFSNKF